MKEQFIKNTPLFGELSETEQRAIGKRMRLEAYESNGIIFSQNGDSDALYLIKDGWVKLYNDDGQTVIASLGAGSLIGDTDLLLGQPYKLTARASGQVELWSLNQAAMQEIIAEKPDLGIHLGLALGKGIVQFQPYLSERLADVPLLGDLSAREQSLVAQYLTPQKFKPNETIFRSGDQPTGLYFVESGAVRLLGDNDDDYTELADLDAFGEMSAISGRPHANTAQAAGEVILWQLSPADLSALTESYPTIKSNLSRNLRARLSASDQSYAVAVLRRIPIFSELSGDILSDVARLLLLRYVPAGEMIFSQGDPGDAMYIVNSGSIDIFSEEAGKSSQLVGRFTDGDYFGETALLTGKTRTVTAYAVTDANLWCLYRTDFDSLMVKHPQISAALSHALKERLSAGDDYAAEPHLKKIALLGGLSRTQLDELSSLLQPRRYQGGSTISYEGSSSDEMYFIEQGQVELWATTAQGPVLIESLGESDYFGEIALLSGRPHLGTAYAVSDTHIWALTKADFDSFLRRYPNLGVVLSRILSERMEETMSRLRGGPAQRSLPAPSGPSRPVAGGPTSRSLTPVTGPQPGGPSRPTGPLPPVPVRRVGPPGQSQPALPPRAMTPVSRGGPSPHGQFTQPMAPTPRPNPPGRPAPPASVHSQFTQGMPPVRPAQTAPPPSRPNPAASRPTSPQSKPAQPVKKRRKVKKRRAQTTTGRNSAMTAPMPVQKKQEASRPVAAAAKSASRPAAGASSRSGLARARSISNRRLSEYNRSVSVWFAKRTLGAKLRLLAIAIALVWICGIMAPSLIINALAATFADNGALPGDERSPLQQMQEDGAVAAVGVLPFVETATPTPSSTPTPTETPTITPTPTSTPIPSSTPTPTMTPTPTETPTPVFTPTPTNTATRALPVGPLPTATPADTPTPEPTPTPNVDFRVKSVRQLTPCENRGKHHIFVRVEDQNGQGINGVPLKVQWASGPDGHVIVPTDTKTDLTGQLDPGRIDFAMFKGNYTVEVTSGTSEVAGPVTPDYGTNEPCGDDATANSLFHISFEVIFQRTY